MKRWLVSSGLLFAMLAFGVGVYHAAGLLNGGHPSVRRPTAITASPLPGTMYLVQSGAIYRFQHGSFTQVTSDDGWMQPAPEPDGHLIVVRRELNFSDLFVLTTSGREVAQLTHDSNPNGAEYNHWAFYPRVTRDGQTLFYVWDPKDPYNDYRVDLAIYASRIGSAMRPLDWTVPNDFTGGDVSPLPLNDGGLIYTKYSIDDQSLVHSQIWIQRRARSAGLALTAPALDCSQPAISPDERLIAMVCSKGSNQSAELDVASFDPAALTLGPPQTLVSGRLLASPAFSPDGKTIAFLAPSSPGGGFSCGPFLLMVAARRAKSPATWDSTPAPRRSGWRGRPTVAFQNHALVVVAGWLRGRFGSRREVVNFKRKSNAPDLHTQLESMLDQVWRSESDWRLWDRLDAAVTAESLREKRRKDRDEKQAA